jgi:hypothetical protein
VASNNRKTVQSWELEEDPVWIREGNVLKPSAFFLKWWRRVAEHRFGDRTRWLDAARELGYVWKWRNRTTGKVSYEAIGFDYDPAMARFSLGLSKDMPVIFGTDAKDGDYRRLWAMLLREEG